MAPSGPNCVRARGGPHERTADQFTDIEHVVARHLLRAKAARMRRHAGFAASRVLCDAAAALAMAASQRVVDPLMSARAPLLDRRN